MDGLDGAKMDGINKWMDGCLNKQDNFKNVNWVDGQSTLSRGTEITSSKYIKCSTCQRE